MAGSIALLMTANSAATAVQAGMGERAAHSSQYDTYRRDCADDTLVMHELPGSPHVYLCCDRGGANYCEAHPEQYVHNTTANQARFPR